MIGKSLGHYELVASLGAGGMGEVYRARDTRLGREVALKLLPASLAADAGRVARLEQEARTVAALRHPGIVTLYSLEEVDGTRFLTMELVEGRTLADVLVAGAPGPAEACRLALPLLDALAYAHGQGVVHRDLKPSNVMLADDGRVLLLDFGIARLLDTAEETGDLATRIATDPGVRVGTPRYMSPEQIRGGTVDARSDVFSVGLLLHELITGQHPFEADNPGDQLSAILRDEAPPCATGTLDGEELTRIVHRCLAKDPADRFPDAGAIREALGELGEPAAPADVDPDLARGREAAGQLRWQEAYDALHAADAREPLGGEDLERLGNAAFWLGHLDEATRLLERTYQRYLDEGNPERAGIAAVGMVEFHEHRSSGAVQAGWRKRAERLLATPGTVGHGHLLRLHVRLTIEHRGDLDGAWADAEQVLDLGRRLGDPELEALGILDQGRILIQKGEVPRGMEMIDEAMAVASATDVDPDITGRIYCSMMASCQMLADYQRAGDWSEAALEWCSPQQGTYPGICRVHRADVLRREGRWREAEDLATQAYEHVRGNMADVAGEACYEIGEIRLAEGKFAEAEEAFREAHELGRDPLPGLARLRRFQDKAGAARSLLRRALEERSHPLDRAPHLPEWVRVCVELGDTDEAVAAAEELYATATTFGSRTYEAAAEHARGLVQLAAGKPGEAVPHLRSAVKGFRDLDLPEDLAWVRLDLGRAFQALGDEENATLEIGAARSTFSRLGAGPAAREAERLLDRS